jgi:hypothetical protein
MAACDAMSPGEPSQPGRIDADFVSYWADRYPLVYHEQRLFSDVRRDVAKRGYYLREEALAVVGWKSPRSRTYFGRNLGEDIEGLTRLALQAPDHLRHRVLGLLDGVGDPVASALLAVACPDRFTVMDFRAIETLQAHGELKTDQPGYVAYLDVCRRVAETAAASDLRRLDRALWQWSKENGR